MERLRRQIGYPPWRQAVNGGPVGIPTDLPALPLLPAQPGAGSEQGQYVRLPGVNFPPAGATPVDIPADANLAPGAVAAILTYIVADSQRLRIAAIGFGADDEVALRFLSWSIRFNTDPAPGYVNIPAAVGSIRQLSELFELAPGGTTVAILATISVNAVLTYRYICRLRGWLYSEKEAV